MSTQTYQVTGMTCGHCESAVHGEVATLPGVTRVEVSAVTGRLVVVAEAILADDAVLAAVDEAGYSAERAE
ncbi:heavy-metal-associated domain-containing protein [Beutenbergia cavernae]|nr:heavy-metal-associated domain-containing protein [Beutenbergia cavernae]